MMMYVAINTPTCNIADPVDLDVTIPDCTDNAPMNAFTKIGRNDTLGWKPTCCRKNGIQSRMNAVNPISVARNGLTAG